MKVLNMPSLFASDHAALAVRTFESDRGWEDTCEQFLASVPTSLHDQVRRALGNLHSGGSGLRNWVTAIAWRGSRLPEHVPATLIEVYLRDEEAAPIWDCETCGIAIPVRVNRLSYVDDEPEYIYFPHCPVCGGRTGLHMYFSRQCESSTPVSSSLRRGKPR